MVDVHSVLLDGWCLYNNIVTLVMFTDGYITKPARK